MSNKILKSKFNSNQTNDASVHVSSTHNDVLGGLYYEYNYRSGIYQNILGELCTNDNNYDGVIYEKFICPIEGFSYEETSCCGRLGDQFCCNLKRKNYFLKNISKSSNLALIAFYISIVVLCFIAKCIYCFNIVFKWKN